ncbi:hypothetical protein EV1_006468 [Malus domestica]
MELSVSNPKNPIFLSKKGISANPKKMTLTPFLWPSSADSLMAGRPAAPFSGQRSSLDGRFDRPEFVPKESRVDEGKCGQKVSYKSGKNTPHVIHVGHSLIENLELRWFDSVNNT